MIYFTAYIVIVVCILFLMWCFTPLAVVESDMKPNYIKLSVVVALSWPLGLAGLLVCVFLYIFVLLPVNLYRTKRGLQAIDIFEFDF